MNNIDKNDIEDILSGSKEENKRYLYKVLGLKGLSAFDVSYIMGCLKLNDNKIKLIEYSISRYSELTEIKESESINEYIFEVVRNIEKLEKSNDKMLCELNERKSEIGAFKRILNYIINGNMSFFKIKNSYPEQKILFSTVFTE